MKYQFVPFTTSEGGTKSQDVSSNELKASTHTVLDQRLSDSTN